MIFECSIDDELLPFFYVVEELVKTVSDMIYEIPNNEFFFAPDFVLLLIQTCTVCVGDSPSCIVRT